MTREARETQLHDRIDELVRELAECKRQLQENTATSAANAELAQQAARHSQAVVDCVRRMTGQPRGAPPNQTPEQIEEGKLGAFGTAEIGRSR